MPVSRPQATTLLYKQTCLSLWQHHFNCEGGYVFVMCGCQFWLFLVIYVIFIIYLFTFYMLYHALTALIFSTP